MDNPVLLLVPWHPSPTIVAVTIIFGWLFWRGCHRQSVSFPRRLVFWAGLFTLYFALHSKLDYYAEREFFVHRIQQMLLRDIGPFLIALAQPVSVLGLGIPERWHTWWKAAPKVQGLARRLRLILINPFVAAILFVGFGWLWLIPPVHFVVMLDVRWYRLMNWTMVIPGLLFWSLILDARPSSPPARLKPAFRVLLAIAVMPLDMAPGVVLTLMGSNFYPLYELCGRAFANISAHDDQTVGGLIIWVGGNTINALGSLVALYLGFYKPEEEELLKESGTRSNRVIS